MSDASVGYAALQIIPSLRGMEQAIKDQLGDFAPRVGAEGDRAATSWGQRFMAPIRGLASDIGDTIMSGVTAAATAGAGLFGAALFKGWDRFATIEDATTALRIQLGDAAAAAQVLDDVLGVVRGTPFNLDQFARGAQQLIGFGVATERVPGLLTAIGEASATQGRRAGEFADRLITTFGQIAAKGVVQLGDVWRIAETGVPALQILANGFGISTDAMREMVSDGAVPAERAIDILTRGIIEGTDGAAGATLAFGGTMEGLRETLTGARGGFGAALARFGASFIAPFASALTSGFGVASNVVDSLGERLGAFATRIVESGPFRQAVEFMESLPERIGPALGRLGDMGTLLAPLAGALAGLASVSLAGALGPLGAIIPQFSPLLGAIAGLVIATPELRQVFGALFDTIGGAFRELLPVLTPILEQLAGVAVIIGTVLVDALDQALQVIGPALVDALPAVGDAIGVIALALADIFTAAAPAIPMLAELAAILMTSIGVPVLVAIAEGMAIIADGLVAMGPVFPAVIAGFVGLKVAFAALTAVMAINPFVLIATAIAGLVVGLVWAYQNVEPFRNAIHAVGRAVAGAASAVVRFGGQVFSALGGVVRWFRDLPGVISGAVSSVVEFFRELPGRILSALGDFAGMIGGFFVTVITNLPQILGFAIGALVAAFVGIPVLILVGLWALGSWLWDQWLFPAISALPGLLASAITGTIDFFRRLPGVIISAIGNFAQFLWNEVFGRAWRFVTDTLPSAVAATIQWFRDLPGRLVGAAGALAGQLRDLAWRGLNFLVGFGKGLADAAAEILTWFANLPGRLLSAMGNLGRILWNAGKEIMNGFLDGLRAGWETVSGWVGSVGGWIRNLKGPLDVDKILLIPAGEAIMDGLLRGLEDGWSAVEAFTSSRGVEIGASFAPQPLTMAPVAGVAEGGAGGTTIINIQADRWTDGTRVGRQIRGELRNLDERNR